MPAGKLSMAPVPCPNGEGPQKERGCQKHRQSCCCRKAVPAQAQKLQHYPSESPCMRPLNTKAKHITASTTSVLLWLVPAARLFQAGASSMPNTILKTSTATGQLALCLDTARNRGTQAKAQTNAVEKDLKIMILGWERGRRGCR